MRFKGAASKGWRKLVQMHEEDVAKGKERRERQQKKREERKPELEENLKQIGGFRNNSWRRKRWVT